MESRLKPTRVGTTDPAKPLLERELELRAFADAVERLPAGVGSMILIEGVAGIGKTRLLREYARIASEAGALVRSARAGELEREMPFAVVSQLLEAIVESASEEERRDLFSGSAELALVALGREDPAKANPERDPVAPLHGLYWLVSNLSQRCPVVLLIDDAQWADRQSLRWLEYLSRRLEDVGVLVVAAVRSGEPDEPSELEPLRLEASVLRPAALSQDAIGEFIAATLSSPAAEFTAACADATGGNPFLLDEALRALRADERPPDAEAARAITVLGREHVARYVLLRLGRHGRDAIALARAIAILGSASHVGEAAELADLDLTEALVLCDRLRAAEIIAAGEPLEFVHPLVRAAIYDELPEGERSGWHRRTAENLVRAGADADQVASHLLACSPTGDQWVVGQLGAAVWEAIRRGAFTSAERYLERALAEPPDDDVALRFALGMCKIQTDLHRAPDVLREVAERTSDPGMRVEALRFTALTHMFNGDLQAVVHWYGRALEAVPEDDREGRLAAEGQLYFASATIRGRRSRGASVRIRDVAEGLPGETYGECLALSALVFERFLSLEPAAEVIAMARTVFPPPPWSLATLAPVGGMGPKVLIWSGDWNTALEQSARLRDFAADEGLLVALSYASTFLSEAHRHAGQLREAEEEARTALAVGREVAPSGDFLIQAATNLISAELARGRIDEAAATADQFDLSAGVPDAAMTPWPIETRGYLRIARGELEAGVEDALVVGDELRARRDVNPALSPWAQEIVPALGALGRTREAEEYVREAEEAARRFGAAHVIGQVVRARALIEPRRLQVESLRESVALLERYGPPHELARSLVELGAALRRDGQRSQAREPLGRAQELAIRCGADGLAERASEELAAAGARPRNVFRTGVESLTASELRAARLAAEGLANREIAQRLFVSRKTVEKHLGNVYTKLEISGRDQLATALAEAPA